MPLFLIERNFAEQLEFTRDGVREATQINREIGVHWLLSFLSADKQKTYCLYEASDPASAATPVIGAKRPNGR